jgi:phosphatidate phosphatase APP1
MTKSSLPRSCLLVAVLVAGPVLAASPHILLFPAVGQPGEVAVHGRVLKQAPSAGSSTLSRNLRRLTSSNWEGAPVEVSFGGQTVKTTAGNDGVFEAVFRPAEGELSPGLHEVEARVPGTAARSTVRVVADASPFFVISDFDDTVAVTHVLSRRGLMRSALLQDGDTQPVVPGMAPLYRCLVEDRTPTPGLAFVSGSPHQFASRMGTFLRKNGFPLAGLYLRDLGPNTLSGYKQPVIRRLMKGMKQPALFFGDSGEADPEVYAEIRREFPDRVLDIYIRDAGRSTDAARFEGMVLFRDAREVAVHALGKGYIRQACFEEAFGRSDAAAEGG